MPTNVIELTNASPIDEGDGALWAVTVAALSGFVAVAVAGTIAACVFASRGLALPSSS